VDKVKKRVYNTSIINKNKGGFNNMKFIDLRSDTVTVPTPEMRNLMANAEVGDDVYRDDPTVVELENLAAEMLGKEAGLFVPSGTFSNQLAIMTHTKRGDEILVGDASHILMYEVAGAAVLSGVQTRSIELKERFLDPEKLESMIRTEDVHYPDTGLICLENALSNGTVISIENMKEIKEVADRKEVPIHLDGARYFNASKSLGVDFKEMAKYVDSISICLSKGLCAPIGSILVGKKDFIEKARKNRKMMGGGLRQVGVLAAPGIFALEHLAGRVDEDHENAKYLAGQLSTILGISVDENKLDINMVFFNLPENVISSEEFVERMAEKNIKINGSLYSSGGTYRFMTHYYVDRKTIDYVVDSINKIISKS